MVNDLVVPVVKRAEEDRNDVHAVKFINDTLKKKVDELLYIATKQA